MRTDHLLTLVDDVGIVQHAHGIIPNRDSGYCVDDVARLAVVSLALAERGDERLWTREALPRTRLPPCSGGDGGMRNFMGYDRRWLDEPHVGDHVGRSIWALGDILATAWIPAVVRPAGDLLDRLVGTLSGDVSLRTAAYTVLGLSRLDSDRLEPAAQALLERLVEQLGDAYEHNASDDWCWFEDALTLRQRTPLAGAPRRAPTRSAGPTSPSARSTRCGGSATSAGSTETGFGCPGTSDGAEASLHPAAATSSRSRPQPWSRPS